MSLKLTITSGLHQGQRFEVAGHDTFLVGRTSDAHCQLTDDKYCSSRHFLLEANPPRYRVINLSFGNGTLLNGQRVDVADVADADEITAGRSTFKLECGPIPLDDCEPAILPASLDLEDPAALEIVIPGYRIEAGLGPGGAGLVYRASRESDGLPLALKVIDPGPKAARKSIDRFLTAAKSFTFLQNPNIVSVHEVGEASGVLYVAMELVEGHSLAERVAERGPGMSGPPCG